MAKTQTLSFPIRLPDVMQAEALRLLDASTTAINQIITQVFPQLDLFTAERTGPAWKQVERHLLTRSGHGSRQERCQRPPALHAGAWSSLYACRCPADLPEPLGMAMMGRSVGFVRTPRGATSASGSVERALKARSGCRAVC